jgi:hypothetical protein
MKNHISALILAIFSAVCAYGDLSLVSSTWNDVDCRQLYPNGFVGSVGWSSGPYQYTAYSYSHNGSWWRVQENSPSTSWILSKKGTLGDANIIIFSQNGTCGQLSLVAWSTPAQQKWVLTRPSGSIFWVTIGQGPGTTISNPTMNGTDSNRAASQIYAADNFGSTFYIGGNAYDYDNAYYYIAKFVQGTGWIRMGYGVNGGVAPYVSSITVNGTGSSVAVGGVFQFGQNADGSFVYGGSLEWINTSATTGYWYVK